MPRYFFHVHDGSSDRDDTGTELPDIYAAQEMAIRYSGELLSEMGAKFWNGEAWRLEVTDARGAVLFVLQFSAEEHGLTGGTAQGDADA